MKLELKRQDFLKAWQTAEKIAMSKTTIDIVNSIRINAAYDHGVTPSGKIPKYEEMKELVVKEHVRFPHNRIIGWDLALDEKENIICIEYNSNTPGVIGSQFALGPIFMQKTPRGRPLLDEILSEA